MDFFETFLNITPIDGRYKSKCKKLNIFTSEYGLFYYRVKIEILLLKEFSSLPLVKECPLLSKDQENFLNRIVKNFSKKDFYTIKKIEKFTQHDIKSVEYFIKNKLAERQDMKNYVEFVHFACTSEDINNLSYALQLLDCRDKILLKEFKIIAEKLDMMSYMYAKLPMLSRTHGQSASPTTLGKEFRNFEQRLVRQLNLLSNIQIFGKFNGAVGNFNAHVISFPEIDWIKFSKNFVTKILKLNWNPHTTQIEPHDYIAEYFHNLIRINIILIDLCRDIWGYIALGYFKQNIKKGEVGSSTMPHKINPIHLENAEGNLGLSNALLNHMAMKLPISRWQRDLTDSTVLRNIGTALSYIVIGIKSLQKGLNMIEADLTIISKDLNENWIVLSEAIQTIMRRYKCKTPYEKVKEFTDGKKKISKKDLYKFIKSLNLSQSQKNILYKTTPSNYIGYAIKLSQFKLFSL